MINKYYLYCTDCQAKSDNVDVYHFSDMQKTINYFPRTDPAIEWLTDPECMEIMLSFLNEHKNHNVEPAILDDMEIFIQYLKQYNGLFFIGSECTDDKVVWNDDLQKWTIDGFRPFDTLERAIEHLLLLSSRVY